MRTHGPLVGILILYLLLAGLLVARVPLNAAPDEAAHWYYVEAIADGKSLPVFKGQVPPQPGYEFHQPPLYYLLCVPAWAMTGPGVENYACRVISVLLGGATLVCIWGAALTLFPARRDIAVLSTGLAAIWPLHLAVSAVVSNDSLAGLICAALFLLMARGGTEGWTTRDLVFTGALIAAGIWTKTTTVVIGVAALGCIWTSKSVPPRMGSQAALVSVGVTLAAATPLFIRNQLLYGDPLALGMFQAAATVGTPGYPVFSIPGAISPMGISFNQYFRGIFTVTAANAWGVYGGPDTASRLMAPLSRTGPRIVDAVPQLLFLGPSFAAICAMAGLLRARGVFSSPANERWQRLLPIMRWWGIGVALVVLAWLQFSYNHFSGAQARYLHAALLPVCVGFAVGWTQVWGRGAVRIVTTIVFAVLLLFSVYLNLTEWKTLV